MSRMIASLSIIALLGACASPYTPKISKGNEKAMGCKELLIEVEKMRSNIKEAMSEAGFEWSYILIIPGMISNIRINRAVDASEKRIEFLESIIKVKNCAIPAPMPLAEAKPNKG